MPEYYHQAINSNKYLTGLGVTCSSDPNFDNYFYLNYCWNEAFDKGVLEKSTKQSIALSSNYLPMLIVLRKLEANLENDISSIETTIKELAAKCGRTEIVNQLIRN